jgi:uncharacterized membrane protein YdfJ with MMPL/SSD domain
MQVDSIFGAIGRTSVRFRWLIVIIWIAGAALAHTQLPSLASVTQNNNTKFLPASAPSEHAARLAAPFGTAGLVPVTVVAARSSGPLTSADVSALGRLQGRLRSVSGVSKVLDAGRSPDGHAEQVIVLATQGGGNSNATTDLVDGLGTAIARAHLPAGLRAHLACDIAAAVDQQKASGATGNKVQYLSLLFIIVLLVLIFRSLTPALTTVAPALISVTIAGPLVAEAARHGLQVSPIAQLLLIVLVLGAGTDYGLFLVFRVREELRAQQHQAAGENYPGTAGLARSLAADLLHPRVPQASANPTTLIFRFPAPAWSDPAPLAAGTGKLQASGLFTTVTGPLNPVGAALTPAQYTMLHASLGSARALPAVPPQGTTVPIGAYQAYRATANYVSAGGKTVQYYLAALGLSVLIFIRLGNSGGLVFFMPFLMFIFLLALGEDYNILVMTRIREEAQRYPLRQAVARALSRTGTTVTSAGLVLAGTFIVLTAVAGSGSGGTQVRDIGLGLALGVLMDTFLVRTLLVPSTVVLLGRWNWWPGRLRQAEPAAEPVAVGALSGDLLSGEHPSGEPHPGRL